MTEYWTIIATGFATALIIIGSIIGMATMFYTVYYQHRETKAREYDMQFLMRSEAFDTLRSVVQTVVMSIEQEEKRAEIPRCYNSAEEYHESLRELAYNRVISQLSDDTLNILSDNIQDLDEFILQLISQQVLLVKKGIVSVN